MLGIVQEQHGDRAALFMQWKNMDWPIMVDSLDQLDVSLVPIHVLIDEHGIVRSINPSENDFAVFMKREFDVESHTPLNDDRAIVSLLPGDEAFLRASTAANAMEDRARAWATAIKLYSDAIANAQEDNTGRLHFRLGVAYRARADSGVAQPGDFERAIEHWVAARATDPNQYIWRRRIQQYGPRLDKPYSFYDWVSQAREDIKARGETPVELRIEPRGAELATPVKTMNTAVTADVSQRLAEYDAVTADGAGDNALLAIETIVVPHTNATDVYRVHIVFQPRARVDAHWNNEAEPMQVIIDVPDGWEIDENVHELANAETAASNERRLVECEVRRTDEADSDTAPVLRFRAVYNICEGIDGVCMFRRSDGVVHLPSS